MQKVTSDHSAHTEKNFDVLGDVLETLRFRGSIFFRSQLAAPWGMKLESAMAPRFHIAMDGNCVLGAGEDSTLVKLKHMDIVLLPHGDMHWIADQPDRELAVQHVLRHRQVVFAVGGHLVFAFLFDLQV